MISIAQRLSFAAEKPETGAARPIRIIFASGCCGLQTCIVVRPTVVSHSLVSFARAPSFPAIIISLAAAATTATGFCVHHRLPHGLRRELRQYFHETMQVRLAEKRQEVVSEMSPMLRQNVLWAVNGEWLQAIPCFTRAERSFLCDVAAHLKPSVFVQGERPPGRRLYVIFQGCALYDRRSLTVGESWGGMDMMMRSVRPQLATACTYLHVYVIEGAHIEDLAAHHPSSYSGIRRWIMCQSIKAFLLENLRLHRKQQWKLEHSGATADNANATAGLDQTAAPEATASPQAPAAGAAPANDGRITVDRAQLVKVQEALALVTEAVDTILSS